MSKLMVMVCAVAAVTAWAGPVQGQFGTARGEFGTAPVLNERADDSIGVPSDGTRRDANLAGEPEILGEMDPAFELIGEDVPLCQDCPEDEDCCCECPVETIAHGEISGYRYGDLAFRGLRGTIRDPFTWTRFWERHTSNVDPQPPIPPVNFEESSVLVTLLGTKRTGGGSGIGIARATRCEGLTMVHVAVRNRRGPLDVITNPFHIALVSNACVPPFGSVGFVSHAWRRIPGTIVGRVSTVDSADGELVPVADALVRLVRHADEPAIVAQTHTNEEGFYRFGEVRPGMYQVIAVAEGLGPQVEPARVHPGQSVLVNFVLHPNDGSSDDGQGDDDLLDDLLLEPIGLDDADFSFNTRPRRESANTIRSPRT